MHIESWNAEACSKTSLNLAACSDLPLATQFATNYWAEAGQVAIH